jgi:hypothetical protein
MEESKEKLVDKITMELEQMKEIIQRLTLKAQNVRTGRE